MPRFTFAKLAKLGEMDEKYGQTYWGETNEQLEPVKFNSMNENITAENTIEAEEILLKTSTKGIKYHQLKKVRVVAMDVPNAAGMPASTEVVISRDGNPPMRGTLEPTKALVTQLGRIEAKLDKLLRVQQEVEQAFDDVPDFLRVEDEDGTS